MFERPHHDNWTWRPPEDQWRKKDSGHQRRATETKGRHSNSTIDHGVLFAVSNTFLKMLEPGDKGSERLLPLCLHTFCRTSNTHQRLCPNLDLRTWGKRPTWTTPSRTSTAAITLSDPPWRLQCQSRSRPWILVFLLGLLWSWQDKRERAAPVGALLLSWPLPDQLLSADEATTQNVMAPPSIQALTLARHGHC